MTATYQRLGVVATNAHATVWKATDLALNRAVALKEVHDVDAANRLRSEAAVLAKLRHPNIVRVHDVVDTNTDAGTSTWLVEQWVDGAPLKLVMATLDRLPERDALALIRGALLGLAYSHSICIVHGDVSPANILIDGAGNAMLVDFGLAAWSGTPGSGGTPGYVAPEVVRGHALDPRCDVYSSSVVVAELLTGSELFRGSSGIEMIAAQARGVSALPDVAQPIAEVLLRGISIERAERQADAAELLDELDAAVERVHGTGWLSGATTGSVGAAAATIALGLRVGGGVSSGGGRITFDAISSVASGSAQTRPLADAIVDPSQLASETTRNLDGAIDAGERVEVTSSHTGVLPPRLVYGAGALIVGIAIFGAATALRDDPDPATASQDNAISTLSATQEPTNAAQDSQPASVAGTYSAVFSVGVGTGSATITSDCATCPITLTANGTVTVANYESGVWVAVVASPCGPATVTLTPISSVDGLVRSLAHHASATGCSTEITGTFTRVG